MYAMKKVIKRLIARTGYKIERIGNPNPLASKFEELVKEHYGAYRDLKFANLPELDPTVIELITCLDGTQVSEAIYILSALEEIKGIEGDICEFGIAQGYTSALLAHSIRKSEKEIWLFDSFQGLPAPTEKDKLKDDIFNLKSLDAYQGTMKHSMESVLGNLAKINFPKKRIHIVDGFIEKTILNAETPNCVAFAYVDFDFYFPIKTALDFLNKVLAKNGVIIVDDYDFFSEGAKLAVDEFYERNRHEYSLELPLPSAGHFAILRHTV